MRKHEIASSDRRPSHSKREFQLDMERWCEPYVTRVTHGFKYVLLDCFVPRKWDFSAAT